VSSGLRFQWDARRPIGQRIVAGSVRVNGQPLDLQRSYRVTVNNFLAYGGDGYPSFKKGRGAQEGVLDHEALTQFLQSHPQLAPAAMDRVQKLN